MDSREGILRVIHSVLQNEESYNKHAQDIVDQIIIKNNIAIENVVIQLEKYLLNERRSITEKTRSLRLLSACTKMREVEFLRYLAGSSLVENIKKFCVEFEHLRNNTSSSQELVGKKTSFGEIKEASQWVSLHDMLLEKINMWSNSFGDLFEGKFRGLRDEIEPEIRSNRIFSSRMSISMDPGTQRLKEEPQEMTHIEHAVHKLVFNEKEKMRIPDQEEPISKEGMALRNRYIKSQTKMIYTLSYLEETLRSSDIPEIFHDFFETLVQELEPCIKEYDEILKQLHLNRKVFNKPELDMFTMEKEFMIALVSEYRSLEIDLSIEAYSEFRETVLGMVAELKKKSEHSPETKAQHKKTNEIISKVRGSGFVPDNTPSFDSSKKYSSFTDLNSNSDTERVTDSKKLEQNLRKRASRVELIDYVSSISNYFSRNPVLNEDFTIVFAPVYQGLVQNHKKMEEINKKELLSATSLKENDNMLLKEGEFTNTFIKEYRALINNLNEKSYQHFRTIILELIEKNKAKGILSPLIKPDYINSPASKSSIFDYSLMEDDHDSLLFEEEVRSHSFLLMGIKDELIKAEHLLLEKNNRFEKTLIENIRLRKERAGFFSEIKALRIENEGLRKALSEMKEKH